MALNRGITISEAPTSLVPPVQVDSAMPVFFVTAPVHLAEDPYAVTNKPLLVFTLAEAARRLGHNIRPEIWDNYTSAQVLFSQFNLYAIAPFVVINVLDPTIPLHVCQHRVQSQKSPLPCHVPLCRNGLYCDLLSLH